MAAAEWWCAECQTFGGGSPNYMTKEAHIDLVHDGGVAEMCDAENYKE